MATKNEIIGMIRFIETEYPDLFSGLDKDQLQMKTDFWYESLKQYDAKILRKAAEQIVREYRTTPKLSHIIARLEILTTPAEMTNEELWADFCGRMAETTKKMTELYYAANSEINSVSSMTDVEEIQKNYKSELRSLKQSEFDALSPILKSYAASVDRYIDLCFMEEKDLQFERAGFLKRIDDIRATMKRNTYRGEA
ncbi:MAG: hypothetical protein LUD47_03235 [Clostridia bacterium]|nr:hypothetical protein [Clostridia bacterium]